MKKIQFTAAEINQLLTYIENRQREGWYYGDNEQFEKRERAIIKKLQSQIKEV